MLWQDVNDRVRDWSEKLAESSYALRSRAANLISLTPIGYYLHPERSAVGIFALGASDEDFGRCKRASADFGEVERLSGEVLVDPVCRWVKVAYSPTIRRAGELLNFFPGQYPGGIPNAPSPLAAMLTSGLLGAGLGWGTGRAIGAMLPEGYGKKLGRTGAAIGAAAGAVPGLAWGLGNHEVGRNFNDPAVLDTPPDAPPDFTPTSSNTEQDHRLGDYLGRMVMPRTKRSEDSRYKQASQMFASSYYRPESSSPLDVNIDAIGQTLWDYSATPDIAATTMGTLYAARQMPDNSARPGWVTAHQLGQFAENAAGDYVKGLLVGAALNQVVGTPFRASTYGVGNVALGVIGAVVPKLFGR